MLQTIKRHIKNVCAGRGQSITDAELENLKGIINSRPNLKVIAEQTNRFYNKVNGKALKGKLEGRSAPGVYKQLEGIKNMLKCAGATTFDTCVKAGTFAYDVLMSAEQGLTAQMAIICRLRGAAPDLCASFIGPLVALS